MDKRPRVRGKSIGGKFLEEGLRLYGLRLHYKLTQEDFCARVNLRVGNYCRYEIGHTKPPVLAAEKIANAFGVSLDYIYRGFAFTELDKELMRSNSTMTRRSK